MTCPIRFARLVVATTATLALGAFGQLSAAATGSDGADGVQAAPAVAHNADMRREQAVSGTGSPLTLIVQTPSGGTSRLTYVENDGWRVDDRTAARDPDEARVMPVATQQEDPAVKQPLTVFIDGPSGYTYVWMRDEGWKFVGRIAGRSR